MASDIFGVSGRPMIETLIAGQRDPHVLAQMPKAACAPKEPPSSKPSPGASTTTTPRSPACCSTESTLAAKIEALEVRIGQLIAESVTRHPVKAEAARHHPTAVGHRAPRRDRWHRRGCRRGHPGVRLRPGPVPTAGHLVSLAKLSPRTIQSVAKSRSGKTVKGNPYLKGVLGDAAMGAAKTDTFLGECYRRLARRVASPRPS